MEREAGDEDIQRLGTERRQAERLRSWRRIGRGHGRQREEEKFTHHERGEAEMGASKPPQERVEQFPTQTRISLSLGLPESHTAQWELQRRGPRRGWQAEGSEILVWPHQGYNT